MLTPLNRHIHAERLSCLSITRSYTATVGMSVISPIRAASNMITEGLMILDNHTSDYMPDLKKAWIKCGVMHGVLHGRWRKHMLTLISKISANQ